jgi:hypothetical protein
MIVQCPDSPRSVHQSTKRGTPSARVAQSQDVLGEAGRGPDYSDFLVTNIAGGHDGNYVGIGLNLGGDAAGSDRNVLVAD